MWNVDRLRRGYELAARTLLDEATTAGPWTGELSSSPLSTATAIAALQLVGRDQPQRQEEFEPLVQAGLRWLVEHQNADGGWGDTILSHSNISTTTLAYASFHLADARAIHADAVARSQTYIDQQGGFDAIRQRYGKDHTFSVPILTQCALAGLIPWQQLTPLPFELGCLPHWFYRWIHLPVVSYALPALIAIGQVRHYKAPSRNPLIRWIRQATVGPTLRRLRSIQPESGGFLEATPLTSFVTMSLAAMKQGDHPVARLGVDFIKASVRSDGSWPIDTNLATWVTTLSVNALRSETLPKPQGGAIADWLLGQQHRVLHRYTNAAPGGWAWTNLSGGVPDADDTPGAILALLKLNPENPALTPALESAIHWLLDLQNNDGGWPTFCRGWGALPFDRSTPDLTAHALRALRGWLNSHGPGDVKSAMKPRIDRAVAAGFAFLTRTQRAEGTWLPLWFGNQFSADEENPVYGVSRALAAYRDWNRLADPAAVRAITWLASVQGADGGWGGARDTPSSTEETSLAVEALLPGREHETVCRRGLDWLLDRVESGMLREPAPIGLYFARLWYFERLYPIIFAVSALARAVEQTETIAPLKLPFPSIEIPPSKPAEFSDPMRH
jgi:squalene-hopene/tetraprenyl-beta-curcumene cyclase